jgi:hypothetical protein
MKGRLIIVLASVIAIFCISIYLLFAPKPYQHTAETRVPSPMMAAPEEWKNYAPPSQEFSVSIPTLPQHAAEEAPAQNIDGYMHYDIYFAQAKSGTTFVINVIEYPPSFDISNPDVVLNGVMQEMLGGNQANQLVSSSHEKFLEYPSIEFILKNPDVEACSKAILKGRKLYVLTVMDRDAQLARAAFSRFIGSLQFLPPIILPMTPDQEKSS